MHKRIYIVLLCVIFAVQAKAASVWKVSKGEETLYLGGTIHVLSQNDYPLPQQYESAYNDADTLVFETDVLLMGQPEFQQQSMAAMLLSDNKTIKDFVTSETYNKLEKHLKDRGIAAQSLAMLKPGFLSVTLSIIELQVMGIQSAGVDQYYATKAQGDGKTILWFESPEEQLAMLANLGQGNEDALINYSIEDIKLMPTAIPQMMDAWRQGDMQALADVGLLEMKQQFPEVYQSLIVQRNLNWMPAIEQLMENEKREFVLVGAMHLAGPNSVISMLKAKGYDIEKL